MSRAHAHTLALLVVCWMTSLMAAGCSKARDQTPNATQPVTSAPVAVSTAPSVRQKDASTSADAGTALRDAMRSYARAMADGRAATKAKRYGSAAEAFDRALAARPKDRRAEAEKGYALYLGGKLDEAAAALDLARGDPDPVLAAQVWFNLGLVAEAKGQKEVALRAFATSNARHASKGAAAKLDGGKVCSADVTAATATVRRFPTWIAVRNALRAESSSTGCELPDAGPEGEGEAQASLAIRTGFGEGDPRPPLGGAPQGEAGARLVSCGDATYLAFQSGKGIVLSSKIGESFECRCGDCVQYEITVSGGVVAVSYAEDAEMDTRCASPVCEREDDGLVPCEPGEEPRFYQMCCAPFEPEESVTTYFRLADGAPLAKAHFPSNVAKELVTFADGGIVVDEGTCIRKSAD